MDQAKLLELYVRASLIERESAALRRDLDQELTALRGQMLRVFPPAEAVVDWQEDPRSIVPDWDDVDSLRAAIERSTEENGLVQAYRWRLKLLTGEAAECSGCGAARLPDDLQRGFCGDCSANVEGPSMLMFLHVQKCAGHTLRKVIEQNYASTLHLNEAKQQGGWTVISWWEQLNPSEQKWFCDDVCRHDAVIGHFPYGLDSILPRPCRYITMLRHPLDRFVSLYEFLKTRPEWDNGQLGTLEDFATNDYATELKDNHTVRVFCGESAFKEIEPMTRAHLDIAAINLRQCAFVGLVEHFDRSLEIMQSLFGWRDISYTVQNANPKRQLRVLNQIDDELLAKIEPRIALDRELYRIATQMFLARGGSQP